MSSILVCGRFEVDLDKPRIMAIINVTPDSFSGPGYLSRDAALRAAEQAVAEGADFLDIGGESSRPGAQSVSEQEELDRVLPVVEALVPLGIPISVDTVKPVVMRESIATGADMINDIAAFRTPGALEAVKDGKVALCVMHMQGEPGTMQVSPSYGDVVQDVRSFLDQRIGVLRKAGVSAERIVADPGFGFGKTLAHNVALLKALALLRDDGFPLLVGMSRKTMLGEISGRPVGDRLAIGAAAALVAVQNGARIVRTHDVGATRDVLRLWDQIR